MSDPTEHYDDAFAAFLEAIWGEGFMSPGGAEEVARVLDGLSLREKGVLDIGCGTGAIARLLVQTHHAGSVVGLDVEESVCNLARQRADEAGLSDAISIVLTDPGPLPFEDGVFDVVFSKDSIIHVEDKEALAAEVFRVLRPGGWFAASDWLSSHDGDPTPEMAHYVALEDLDFAMASPARYQSALEQAGFDAITLTDRNPWYHAVAHEELRYMSETHHAELVAKHGDEMVSSQIEIWQAMCRVLDSGELRPYHLRAQRP